jgi:predicted phosphodiesterase
MVLWRLVLEMQEFVAYFAILSVAIAVAIAVAGPVTVFLATQFGLVGPASTLWRLRRDCPISASSLASAVAILIVLGITVLASSRVRGSRARFFSLVIERLIQVYVAIPFALYCAICGWGLLQLITPFTAARYNGHADAGTIIIYEIITENPLSEIAGYAVLGGILYILYQACAPIVRGIGLTRDIFRPYSLAAIRARKCSWLDFSISYKESNTNIPPDILVVSDLHFTSDGESTLEPGGIGDPAALLAKFLEETKAKVLIIAGDVTDTGSSEQWKAALLAFKELGKIELIAAPGNHDYHFRRISVPGFGDASFSQREVSSRLAQLMSTQEANFPRIRQCETSSVDVITLDSNTRRSGWPISNAIGYVGEDQLQRARCLASTRCPARPLLILLHHHIIPQDLSVDAPFLLCIDHEQVLRFALEVGASAVIHGHTHQPFICTHKSGLIVISCGSLRFPAQGVFKTIVKGPSAYSISIEGGKVCAVQLIT